jgi:hypothetical protein
MVKRRTKMPHHLVLAYHWHEWAMAIDGANELIGQEEPIEFLPFLDASEVIEYVYPHSLAKGDFPTRLDLSLSLLFSSHRQLFVFGPHAQEINGVRQNWHERMALVLKELMLLQKDYDMPQVQAFEQELEKISVEGLKSRAEDLIQLLSDNHEWIFAAWRVPHKELPALFDRVLRQLHRPAIPDLALPKDFTYTPHETRIDEWLACLDATDIGRGEPGPNMVDAYVLDQLAQIARAAPPNRLPILFTHSSKVFQAMEQAPPELSASLRINGISILQPPQVALVLRLRSDAIESDTLPQLTEELERQREHCQRITALVEEINAASKEQPAPSELHEGVKQELKRLDGLSMQWNALENLRQTIDTDVRARTTGMAQGLLRILQSPEDGARLRSLLGEELARLVREVDQLQTEISRRPLADEEPKGELELEEHRDELTAFVVPNPLMRPRREPLVPSAMYPTAGFHFRDARTRPYLKRFRDTLKTPPADERKPHEERERAVNLWRLLKEFKQLDDHPEYYLVLAVVYLAQEKWLQAYDMAGDGIEFVGRSGAELDHEGTSALAELLLTRAGAARAFVHATRVDVPSACRAFLETAITTCFQCLEIQSDSAPADARCLRELAVIYGSSQEPLYGPGDSPKGWDPLDLYIDRQRLSKWISISPEDDSRRVAAALARRAWELGSENESLKYFFVNTHLYAMTEVDRLLLAADASPQHEKEREDMALDLKDASEKDANFTDTLMWHEYVLALGHKKRAEPWSVFAENAADRSRQIGRKDLTSNLYYRRLIMAHRQTVGASAQQARAAAKVASSE